MNAKSVGLFLAALVLGLALGLSGLVRADDKSPAETEQISLEAPFVQDGLEMNTEGTGPLQLLPDNAEPATVNQVTFVRRIAGINFVPRDSDQTHDYGNAGCIQGKTTGTGLWSHALTIPDGSTIEQLTYYFYDNNIAATTTAWITRFDNQGGTEDLTSVASTDTAGYGSLSTAVSHEVDNVNYAYVLYVRPGSNDNTVRACGVAVTYQLNISEITLPVILNNYGS